MNKDSAFVQSDRRSVTCVLECKSAEILRQAKELASKRIDLGEIVPRTLRYFPKGVEKRIVESYRLGDYFEKIELADEATDDLSFKLIFHPRQGVTSYWKDLMMAVLKSISDSSDGVVINSMVLSKSSDNR